MEDQVWEGHTEVHTSAMAKMTRMLTLRWRGELCICSRASIGLYVTSKEYEGAEREARCWLEGPEELDDVVNFLGMHVLGKFSLDMDQDTSR